MPAIDRTNQPTAFLARLAASTVGNVLPLVAVGTVVLAGLVGGGVDMAQAYKAERRLQAACDAGVLAGRRAVASNGFDSTAEAQADAYFNANFDEDEQRTSNAVFTPTSPDDGDTVNGTATATVDTIVMSVFGFDSMDISVSCAASMGVGNSDIMMVLDSTTSMTLYNTTNAAGQTVSRWSALKSAMNAFYTTVTNSAAGSNARIRLGFVPYSSAVNAKYLLQQGDLSSDAILNSITVQSRQPTNWTLLTDNSPNDDAAVADGSETTASNWANVTTSPTNWTSYSACETYRTSHATYSVTPSAWTAYGSETTSSTNKSLDGDTSALTVTSDLEQVMRRNEYRCNRSGTSTNTSCSSSNRCYVQIRVREYDERYRDIKTYNPSPVTTNGVVFSDYVFKERTFDTSNYKTFAAVTLAANSHSGSSTKTSANLVSAVWEGCIHERQTESADDIAFVSLDTGITPSGAYDLNIDSEPDDDANRWAPLWPELAYYRRTSSSGSATNDDYSLYASSATTYCPSQMRLMEEMSSTDFTNYVTAMVAEGYTYHDTGLIWGARLTSPTGMFADNVNEAPANGGTVSRHLIFMTDGELQPDMSMGAYVQSAYGIEFHDRHITDSGTSDEQMARHRLRYLALCEAIKARGIRLWVIAFGTTLTDDLDGGDGDGCSSPDSAFAASNGALLNQYFQEIANQVGELRIVQ